MNILFYHKRIIDPTSGGISRITQTLSEVFESKGHIVYFLAEFVKPGCKYSDKQLILPDNDFQSSNNIRFFFEALNLYKIDVVINQYALSSKATTFFNLCKQQKDFKLISCFHNSILTPIYNYDLQKEYFLRKKHLSLIFYVLRAPIIKQLLKRIYIQKHRSHYKKAVHISDAVVNLCSGLQQELEEMIGEKASSRYFIIPNCLNISTTKSKEKQNIILWVGTFSSNVKRPDVMLDVWAHIVDKHLDWSLVFLGDGPALKETIRQAEQRKIKNVSFEGRVSPDDYYKKAKIMCVTSTHESFSLVTVEAKSYGVVPILMNTFPAASLIVNNGIDGILIDSYDMEKFAKALEYMMSNDVVIENLSESGLQSIKEFSSEKVYNQWYRLFMNIGVYTMEV